MAICFGIPAAYFIIALFNMIVGKFGSINGSIKAVVTVRAAEVSVVNIHYMPIVFHIAVNSIWS